MGNQNFKAVFFGLAIFLLAQPGWAILENSPHWQSATLEKINSTTNFKKKIPLTLVNVEKTGWNRLLILGQLRTTEKIFSQCQITFSPILLIEGEFIFENPGKKQMFSSWDHHNATVSLEQMPKPMVFFGNEPKEMNPEENELGQSPKTSYSYPKIFADGYDVVHTAFLTFRSNANGYLKKVEDPWTPGYSTLAHELAHILFNQGGHINEPGNLLCHSGNCAGPKITQRQCDSILKELIQK